MVKEKKVDEQTIYICEGCGLGYKDKTTAKECEEWCRKTGTCKIELTKRAIYFPGLPSFPYGS